MRERSPLPNRIQNAPTLGFGLELFFTAFEELDPERSEGTIIGSIPRHRIVEYCKELELDEEQTDDMLYHIRQMDKVYLKHANKKK